VRGAAAPACDAAPRAVPPRGAPAARHGSRPPRAAAAPGSAREPRGTECIAGPARERGRARHATQVRIRRRAGPRRAGAPLDEEPLDYNRPAPASEFRPGVSAISRYRFGDRSIDLAGRDLRLGQTPIEVEAKVFDLIELLLLNRERALGKREINDALWSGRPVTDAALSQLLRKARRALGDDGTRQAVIRTVHGRGLQWVAAIAPDVAATAESPLAPAAVHPADADTTRATRRRLPARPALAALAAALALLAALAFVLRPAGRHAGQAQHRIAVLPVAERSGDAALDWTRSGLMGLMAGLLQERGGAEVVATGDVQALPAAVGPLDAAALARLRRALGATHFVVAALDRTGPLYALDLRLVAAGGAERHETLHSTAPTALAVQAVARVRAWLGLDAGAGRARDDGGIAEPFLAEAYARGLDAQARGDHAGAKKYFDICLDRDPGLAWPRLRLAVSQGLGGEAAASRTNAELAAAAARERGDDALLVPALRQLAVLAFRRGELDAAAAHLDEALSHLPPERPLALADLLVVYASIDDERGRHADARARFERALALARGARDGRREAEVLINLAAVENAEGRLGLAATRLRESLDVARAAGDAHLEATAIAHLGAVEYNRGRPLEAARLLRQGLALARQRGERDGDLLGSVLLAWTLAPFGRTEAAEALARRTLAAGERDGNRYWQAEARWALAGLAARRGDWNAAFADFGQAQALYAQAGMTRNAVQALAEAVEAAVRAGDAARAGAFAAAFRQAAAADPAVQQTWGAFVDAQMRWIGGERDGAAGDLERFLDHAPAAGPAAAAALFTLGRWQLERGHPGAVLEHPGWTPYLDEHPDAIALRIAALRALGRQREADAEAARLDALERDPAVAAGAALAQDP